MKKQKTDRKDDQLLFRLMRENNFPQVWVSDPENRDLRQLLWHRHRLVQMRAVSTLKFYWIASIAAEKAVKAWRSEAVDHF